MSNLINFSEFLVEEKRVRRRVLTPKGNEVEIFEPSGDHIQDIYDLLLELETGDISQAELTARIYPMVTNISFEGLSTETIEAVINSDAKELEEINEEIALICTEVMIYRTQRAQVQVAQAQMNAEYLELGAKTNSAFQTLESKLEAIEEDMKKQKGEEKVVRRKQIS